MKKPLLLFNLLFVTVSTVVFAKNLSYIKAKNGIIIFTDPAFTGASCFIQKQ